MLARFGDALLILALLAATGTHWTVLQSAVWATMLAGNLRSNSLVESFQRTFDGKHPCSLCKQIAQGKRSEKKSEFPAAGKKVQFSHVATVFVFSAPAHFVTVSGLDERWNWLNHAPPVPPPKAICG